MPIYEYECQSCGKRIEALQRVNDPPLKNCDCGDEGQLKKLISAPAFQFKGEGWYVTDYARKGKDGSGKDDSGKDTSQDNGKKTESAGSETKTAKAGEAKSDGKTKSERISSPTPSSTPSKSA